MRRDRLSAGALAGLLLPLLPAASLAAWTPDPTVDVVLCAAPANQTHLRGTTDGAGGAIFAWRDDRSGASSSDIYAQRVDAGGTALWGSGGVPVDTSASVQQYVHVASDGAGGAYVMWLDIGMNPDHVRLVRIDGSGSQVWSAKTLSTSALNAQVILWRTQLVADGAGGAIAVWAHINGNVFAQRIDASGTFLWGASGTLVATALVASSNPTIALDGVGGAIVCWRDFRNSNSDVYAQKLDAGGTPQWTANGVSVSSATGNQNDPVVATDGAGGAIIAWKDARTACDVYAQRIDTAGSPQWTLDGILLGFMASFCGNEPTPIVADGFGGAIVTWEGGGNIWAQRVSASDSLLWGASPVAVCNASGFQGQPELVANAGGGATIAWEDRRIGSKYDIFAQRLDPAGIPQGLADGDTVAWAGGDSRIPDVVSAGGGQVIVGFDDQQGGLDLADIHADLYPPSATVDVSAPSLGAGLALSVAPNPSVRRTDLRLSLPRETHVTLAMFDAAGRRVRVLVADRLSAGTHAIRWDGKRADGQRAPAGVYFARLSMGEEASTARVVLLGP